MHATTTGLVTALGALALLGVPGAKAADTAVSGRKLVVKDFTRPGTADRKVVAVSRDLGIAVPAPGSAGDPTLGGGSVTVTNSAGSGESMTIALPADGWKPATGGWKFRREVSDPPTDDYKIVAALKTGRLKVLLRDDVGSLVGYTLDEPSQGSIAVELVTGADRHCMDFGGLIKRDFSEDLGGGVYKGAFGAKDAPAPAGCDASPSGAFVD